MIVNMPGPEGMLSPMRTIAWLDAVTRLGGLPMGSVYGTPVTLFTIKQMEPRVANGCPLAAGDADVMTMIEPVSGGPAIPGLNITEHP